MGNGSRHCQEDGTWSGAPPYCTGKPLGGRQDSGVLPLLKANSSRDTQRNVKLKNKISVTLELRNQSSDLVFALCLAGYSVEKGSLSVVSLQACSLIPNSA